MKFIFEAIPFNIAKKLCFGSARLARYLPSGQETVFFRYDGDLMVNINTDFIIEREMLSGYYDKETTSIINRLVKKGDYCVDLGANIGAITLLMAKRAGPQGKVFSFEPGPFIYERLINNIKLNCGITNITAINKGVSNQAGCLYWVEDKNNRGNASCRDTCEEGTTKVDVIKLDDFFLKNKIEKIDFIKIDIEGMELESIEGAYESIKKFKPAIYYETRLEFEVIRNKKIFIEIEHMLSRLGYQFFKMTKGKFIKVSYPNLGHNTLALP